MSTAKDEIGILGRLSNYSFHYFFSKLLRFLRERNSEDHHTMLHDARLREKRGSHTATLFLLFYSLSQSQPSLPSPSRGSKFSDGDTASKRPFRWPSGEVATLRKKFKVFLLVNSQVLYAFLRGMMHHS